MKVSGRLSGFRVSRAVRVWVYRVDKAQGFRVVRVYRVLGLWGL